MILIPRPYQDKAIDDVAAEFEAGYRSVCLTAPTGAGKTVIFTKIAELASVHGTRTVILVHRDSLMTQAAAKLRECGIPYSLIAPGHSFYGDKVSIASVQTLVRRLGQYNFDFIITDEGHHGTSPTYRKIYDHYASAHILAVTATPCRTDGRGLNEVYQRLVLGPTIRELINDGYLVEPIPYGPKHALSLDNVATRMGDYDLHQLADVMDNRSITGDAVQHYRELCPGKPAVAFCVNVKHAEDVANEFCAGGFNAASVDGKMPLSEIRRRIAGLGDGSIQVLTSCDLVSEGVDVPHLAAIIGLRPTKSLTVYIQQIGRGLRPIYSQGFDLDTRAGRIASIAASIKPTCLVIDHAANTFKFGSADEDREWTLEGKPKRAGNKNAVVNIQARQCPQCYRVHARASVCPECGYVYEVETSTPEITDGKLSIIDKEALSRARRRQVAEAKTYEELKEIGRQRGYKPGWAWHVFNERQRVGTFNIKHH